MHLVTLCSRVGRRVLVGDRFTNGCQGVLGNCFGNGRFRWQQDRKSTTSYPPSTFRSPGVVGAGAGAVVAGGDLQPSGSTEADGGRPGHANRKGEETVACLLDCRTEARCVDSRAWAAR